MEDDAATESELFGQGARWRGQLHGYGDVSYEFLLKIPSIPPGVAQARKELELGEAVWARTAHCVCKPLGLDESVVVSSDSSARLLLQSLVKPDLGRLCLREYRKEKVYMLVGGDETWSPAEAPLVEVSLTRRGPKINRGPLGGSDDEELNDMVVYAAHSGRMQDLDHLLVQHKELGVDLPAAFGPCKGMSPLEAAAGSGRSEIVNYLLDIRKAKLHVGCLAAACRKHDNHAVIRKLIQCGAQAEEGVQIVCTRGDSATLSLLLEYQTALPQLERGLLVSAKNGHGSCLVKILSILKGSYRRQETLTEALHGACKSGRTSTIKILLNHGADPYAVSQNESPPASVTDEEEGSARGSPMDVENRTPTEPGGPKTTSPLDEAMAKLLPPKKRGKNAFDACKLTENEHIITEILAQWKRPKVGRNVLAELQAQNLHGVSAS